MESVKVEHQQEEGDFIIIDNLAVSHRGREDAYDTKDGDWLICKTTLEGNFKFSPKWDLDLDDTGKIINPETQLDYNYNNTKGQISLNNEDKCGQEWDVKRNKFKIKDIFNDMLLRNLTDKKED